MSSQGPGVASDGRRRVVLAAGSWLAADFSGCISRLPVAGGDEEVTPHVHGYLFVVIDGDETSFTQSKYLIGESDRVTTTFHFHAYDEPNRWHMEGQRLVLAAALDALPDVTYRSENGGHVLHIDGETYSEANPNTEITITERGRAIDPKTYRLNSGDVISVRITTDSGTDNRLEQPTSR